MAIDERKIVPGAGDDSPPPPEQHYAVGSHASLKKQRKQTLGIGLLKGMAVTIKHLFKRNTVIQYPDEMQELSPRTRGVIALKEENCTVCMLCARECPDWCIYIDSHKETLPPKRAGGRQRKRNVLDRFAIDYALCMYCGICVEVCPYDALFWSPEFEYSEFDIRELTHEKERLSDWMTSVQPPPPLEVGAVQPGQPEAPAVAAGGAGPGSAQRPSPPSAGTAAAERPEQAMRPPAAAATAAPTKEAATQSQEQAGETQPAATSSAPSTPTEERAPDGPTGVETKAPDTVEAEAVKSDTEAASPVPSDERAREAEATLEADPGTGGSTGGAEAVEPGAASSTASPSRSSEQAPPEAGTAPAEASSGTLADPSPSDTTPTPNVEVPIEEPKPVALEKTEDPQQVHDQVLQEQLDKGASPQVAEARAKVARVKAERGIKRGPTPVETEKLVPSAPTKGQPAEAEPSGAPEAKAPEPDPGPVAPSDGEGGS